MDVKMLDKHKHTNTQRGFLCRYVRSDTEYFRPHYHNYYEIFIVLKGSVCHIINSKEQMLSPGELLFIRDFDIHDYKSADGNYFEFLNIAFTIDNFKAMISYLGEKFPANNLLKAEYPPSIYLSEREKERLFYAFTELGSYHDDETAKIKFRTLLVDVFMKYFFDYKEDKVEIPLWLEIAVEKMKKPENFVKGNQRMYEISGRSREHLSRSLKKYYNITVQEFINTLRLEYCINLLSHSNLSVTDICFECGFENVSWFYKVFEKKYGTSPSKYRKSYNIYTR